MEGTNFDESAGKLQALSARLRCGQNKNARRLRCRRFRRSSARIAASVGGAGHFGSKRLRNGIFLALLAWLRILPEPCHQPPRGRRPNDYRGKSRRHLSLASAQRRRQHQSRYRCTLCAADHPRAHACPERRPCPPCRLQLEWLRMYRDAAPARRTDRHLSARLQVLQQLLRRPLLACTGLPRFRGSCHR